MAATTVKDLTAKNTEDLATPPGVQAQTTGTNLEQQNDNVNRPTTDLPTAIKSAIRAGLSGETVKITLAAGEGVAGREGQFTRVNEHTWIVPRNTETIIPYEAYRVLMDTVPPVPEGVAAGMFAPRFSVSVIERYPAPKSAD